MKGKILALLQLKFASARKDGLNHIANILSFQVNTEDEAKTLVDKLTAEQVASFITDWRKEADAEIEKSNKTREDNLRKKYDFVEKKPSDEPTPPAQIDGGGTIDAAAIQKIVTESIAAATKPLLEQINTFKAGETAKTRLQTLNEKLKECRDETFKTKVLKDFARMKFETDDEFTEYLTDTENDVKTANQNVANLSLRTQGRPLLPNAPEGDKEATDAEIADVMKKLAV
jgi:alpha-galactosidase/6-phospho-beta-glucosidase family protein